MQILEEAVTPEGKVKAWLHYTWLPAHMPGHWRVSPRGGPFGKTGCPDDIICWMGIFIAIEVKSDEGEASAAQMAQLKLIQKAGGVAAVLRGKDAAKMEAIKKAVLAKIGVWN